MAKKLLRRSYCLDRTAEIAETWRTIWRSQRDGWDDERRPSLVPCLFYEAFHRSRREHQRRREELAPSLAQLSLPPPRYCIQCPTLLRLLDARSMHARRDHVVCRPDSTTVRQSDSPAVRQYGSTAVRAAKARQMCAREGELGVRRMKGVGGTWHNTNTKMNTICLNHLLDVGLVGFV